MVVNNADYLIILNWFLQALCRAEDEEDIVAASQAKAEQVAELAEFNENIPLDDGGEQEEVEELSKAEQEIAALVEQVNNHAVLWLNNSSGHWFELLNGWIIQL